MSTHRIRRSGVRLAVAGAVVLAVGTAGCAQPPETEVGAVVPMSETPAPTAQPPEGSEEPGDDERGTADARRVREWPRPSTPSEAPASEPPAAAEPPEPTEPTEPTEPEEAVDETVFEDDETVLEEGDRGELVQVLQERLTELGYWLGPADGSYGSLTEQAVMAFQGWEGLTRDGRAGPATRTALADATRPDPDADGRLIEVHLAEQVLLVVEDGRTELALHTSTGTGERYTHPHGGEAIADTPVGDWKIAWRIDGWRTSDLGRLYRPAYFHARGIAIHGYPQVPDHPASHGCVRVTIDAMDVLWAEGHVARGTRVVVS